MHYLRNHLLMINGTRVVLPFSDCGIEVINDDSGRMSLGDLARGNYIGCNYELAGLTGAFVFQIGSTYGVDRYAQFAKH